MGGASNTSASPWLTLLPYFSSAAGWQARSPGTAEPTWLKMSCSLFIAGIMACPSVSAFWDVDKLSILRGVITSTILKQLHGDPRGPADQP